MKIIRTSTIYLALFSTILVGCSKVRGSQEGGYVGTFVDEFGNRFTLNEDMTSFITIAGNSRTDTTFWSDGENHDQPYATIMFNSDPNYFFLKDGKLFNSRKAMEAGHPSIKLEYQDD